MEMGGWGGGGGGGRGGTGGRERRLGPGDESTILQEWSGILKAARSCSLPYQGFGGVSIWLRAAVMDKQ